jgi:hypothetical protein
MALKFFGRSKSAPDSSRFPFTLQFWLFTACSIGLLTFGAQEIYEAHQARSWPRIPCTIIRSSVESRDGEYRASIEFRYSVDGKLHRSWTVSPQGELWSSDYARAAARVAQFPIGSTRTCLVNPRKPDRAFLEASVSCALLFLAPTPMLIWLLYERVAIAHWWRGRKSSSQRRISDRFAARRAPGGLLLLGLVGLLMSLTFITVLVIVPIRRSLLARNWPAVPCRILEARIIEEHHHVASSFEPQVLFTYEIGGRVYTSSRYNLSEPFASSYASAKSQIEPYPPGSTNACYVPPGHPDRAVLRRDFQPAWFFISFGLGLGVLDVWILSKHWRSVAAARPDGLPARQKGRRESLRISRRRDAIKRAIRFSIELAVSLIVSGLLGVPSIRSLREGTIDALPLIYALVAFFAAVWFAIQLRKTLPALFAPAPSIEISPAILTLGEKFTLHWRFRSSTRQIASLAFFLVAREELKILTIVDTGHGADEQEKTETTTTFESSIVTITEQGFFGEGARASAIPGDGMHSFQSSKSRFIWLIQTRQQLANDSIIIHEFEVSVLPHRRETFSIHAQSQTRQR